MIKKINTLLKALLIKVKDINVFAKQTKSILEMFDKISKFKNNYSNNQSNLYKTTSINNLREDIPYINTTFNKNKIGKYFIVPKVSKKT